MVNNKYWKRIMPGGKTSCCNSWLQGYVNSGQKIWTGCRKKWQFEAYCSHCDSTFSVANCGNDQIMKHSGGKKHSAKTNLHFDKTAWHLSSGEPSKQIPPLTKTHEKELIWKKIWSWSGQINRSTLDAESCCETISKGSLGLWSYWFLS